MRRALSVTYSKISDDIDHTPRQTARHRGVRRFINSTRSAFTPPKRHLDFSPATLSSIPQSPSSPVSSLTYLFRDQERSREEPKGKQTHADLESKDEQVQTDRWPHFTCNECHDIDRTIPADYSQVASSQWPDIFPFPCRRCHHLEVKKRVKNLRKMRIAIMEGAVENTIKAYDVQLKRGEAALGRPGVLVDPNALDREKLKVKANAEKLLKRMDREESACWDRFWSVWLDQDDR